MANVFPPAALPTQKSVVVFGLCCGPLEAVVVNSQYAFVWLTMVTGAFLLIVLWLCLTMWLNILIITFPRGLMAMPQGRIQQVGRVQQVALQDPLLLWIYHLFVLPSPCYFIWRKSPVAKNIVNQWCVCKEYSVEWEDQDRSSVKTSSHTLRKLLNFLSVVSQF